MQAPKFDYTAQRWDRFNAFHVYRSHGVVMFDTGEVICTWPNPDPDHRRTLSAFGIQIVSTADNDCPTLYTEDGTKVLKTWLNRNGQQQIVVDQGLGVAVAQRNYRMKKEHAFIPARLHFEASVYWAGNGQPPHGAPIKLSMPRKLTPEQLLYISEVKSACIAWCAMNGITEARHAQKALDGQEVYWLGADGNGTYYAKRTHTHSNLLGRKFPDLPYKERWAVAFAEPAEEFTVSSHTYLYTSKDGARL